MQKLDLNTLEKKLWDCANILRGNLSSAEYKDYIFGMLFLKRMNDQFKWEREKFLAEYKKDGLDDATIQELLEESAIYESFFVPKDARWDTFKDLTTDIGPKLDIAFKAIEDEPKNSELIGVLTTVNYNNKERIPDAKLVKIIQIFEQLNLSNEGLEKPDILGDAYMYLIKMFADDGGKKGGEFYTPEEVKEVMVRILQPEEGDSIYDPTVGSAGFLIKCIEYVKEQGGNYKNLQLFGQEINLSTWAIAKLNMLLHDAKGATIWKGDVIRDPKNKNGATLMTFDKVIANPPFSLKDWGKEVAETNQYHRFNYGVPPKSYGDFAFVEHMIASLNSKGKMATVVPHGVLFRGGAEGKIRKAIIEDDLLEAVIGLPENLFYGTGIPAAILVLNKNKSIDKKNKTLFIDTSENYEKEGNKNKLRINNIQKISEIYNNFNNVDNYASVIKQTTIKENKYNLIISRYVDTNEHEEEIDVNSVINKIKEREIKLMKSKTEINQYLKGLGFKDI